MDYRGLVQQGLTGFPQLDPNAVFAVSGQEGLGGGIGDGGHAFGPFQLNDAGGVITGKFPGWSPERIQQWAWSPEGIKYALAGIANVASGLKGQAAVSRIVSGFERPADIPDETSRALASLGGGTNVGSPPPVAAQGLTAPSTATPAMTPRAAPHPLQPIVDLLTGGHPAPTQHGGLSQVLSLLA